MNEIIKILLIDWLFFANGIASLTILQEKVWACLVLTIYEWFYLSLMPGCGSGDYPH